MTNEETCDWKRFLKTCNSTGNNENQISSSNRDGTMSNSSRSPFVTSKLIAGKTDNVPERFVKSSQQRKVLETSQSSPTKRVAQNENLKISTQQKITKNEIDLMLSQQRLEPKCRKEGLKNVRDYPNNTFCKKAVKKAKLIDIENRAMFDNIDLNNINGKVNNNRSYTNYDKHRDKLKFSLKHKSAKKNKVQTISPYAINSINMSNKTPLKNITEGKNDSSLFDDQLRTYTPISKPRNVTLAGKNEKTSILHNQWRKKKDQKDSLVNDYFEMISFRPNLWHCDLKETQRH